MARTKLHERQIAAREAAKAEKVARLQQVADDTKAEVARLAAERNGWSNTDAEREAAGLLTSAQMAEIADRQREQFAERYGVEPGAVTYDREGVPTNLPDWVEPPRATVIECAEPDNDESAGRREIADPYVGTAGEWSEEHGEGLPTEPEQLELIPREMPKPWKADAYLVNLPPVHVKPSADMVASARAFGIIEPVILIEEHRGEYLFEIVAGRRRIAAARRAKLATVPAMVYPSGTTFGDILSIIENRQRGSNPVAELEAVQRLQARGATEADIRRATGLTKAELRTVLRLGSLHSDLIDAANAGRLPLAAALKAAKIPPGAQAALVAKVRAGQKITSKDIDTAKRGAGTQSAMELDERIFTVGDDIAGSPRWQRYALESLITARDWMPRDHPLRADVDLMIDRLGE